MYGRLFADQGRGHNLVFADNIPGQGFIYADEIGQPRYGTTSIEDIGDILED